MKIVVATLSLDPTNGWGNLASGVCERLAKGHEVIAYVPRDRCGHNCDRGYTVHPQLHPCIAGITSPRDLLTTALDACAIRESGDVYHALSEFPHSLAIARAAKSAARPSVMTVQGTYGVGPLCKPVSSRLQRWAYEHASLLMTPCHYTLRRVCERCTPQQIEILPNPVDADRFDRRFDISDLRERYRSENIIVSVGALKPRKGFEVMLDAFSMVKKAVPDAEYIIVGEGDHRRILEEKVRRDHLTGVHFVTDITSASGDELMRYYHLCAVFALTPINIDDNYEAFGIVYLEAGASGKPCVGSDSGGVSDAVLNETTGLVVPERDAPSTARAIIRLLENRDEAKRMGEAGRLWAHQNSFDNYVAALEERYMRAAGS